MSAYDCADAPEGDRVLHFVPAPTQVTLDKAAAGMAIGLHIAAAGEPATRVRFRATADAGHSERGRAVAAHISAGD